MRKFAFALTAALVACFLSAAPADAAFKVRITSANFGSVTIEDSFPAAGGGDNSGTEGRIVFNVEFNGGLTVVGNAGTSKPFIGSAANPFMTLNWEVIKSSGAADTVTIEITDTGFTPLLPGSLEASIGGTADFPSPVTKVTYQAFTDSTGPAGAEFGTTGSQTSLMEFTTSPFGDSELFNAVSAPYSLTQKIVVSMDDGQGEASGNAKIKPTPAPAGVVLALAALPGLLLARKLRRRKDATTA